MNTGFRQCDFQVQNPNNGYLQSCGGCPHHPIVILFEYNLATSPFNLISFPVTLRSFYLRYHSIHNQ
jgi:hypothetical protein